MSEPISPAKESLLSGQTEKTFGLLARKVLDGYANGDSDSFSSYVKKRLIGQYYCLALLASPKPDFESEEDLQQMLDRSSTDVPALSCFTTQNHAVVLWAFSSSDANIRPLLNLMAFRLRHTSCVISAPFQDLSLFRERQKSFWISAVILFYMRISFAFLKMICFLLKNPPLHFSRSATPAMPSMDAGRTPAI